MKKFEKTILLIFIAFFIAMPAVYAQQCNGIFTVEAAELIKDAFDLIRIAVPILLLLFGSLDMAQAVISSDPEAIKKSGAKFGKRAFAAILVFFVPLIVNLLLSIPAVKNSLNLVDDPTCGLLEGSEEESD